jgi:hypothetical protein
MAVPTSDHLVLGKTNCHVLRTVKPIDGKVHRVRNQGLQSATNLLEKEGVTLEVVSPFPSSLQSTAALVCMGSVDQRT